MGLFANSSFAFEIFISLSLSVGVCSKMPVTPPFTLFRSGTFKIEMTLLTISFLASSSLKFLISSKFLGKKRSSFGVKATTKSPGES